MSPSVCLAHDLQRLFNQPGHSSETLQLRYYSIVSMVKIPYIMRMKVFFDGNQTLLQRIGIRKDGLNVNLTSPRADQHARLLFLQGWKKERNKAIYYFFQRQKELKQTFENVGYMYCIYTDDCSEMEDDFSQLLIGNFRKVWSPCYYQIS